MKLKKKIQTTKQLTKELDDLTYETYKHYFNSLAKEALVKLRNTTTNKEDLSIACCIEVLKNHYKNRLKSELESDKTILRALNKI